MPVTDSVGLLKYALVRLSSCCIALCTVEENVVLSIQDNTVRIAVVDYSAVVRVLYSFLELEELVVNICMFLSVVGMGNYVGCLGWS